LDTIKATQHNLRQADFRQERGAQAAWQDRSISVDSVSL